MARRAVVTGGTVAVAGAMLWLGLPDRLDGWQPRVNRVKSIAPAGCAECHQDIVRQWKKSAHAEAWTDPAYVKATDDRTTSRCLPCHAPQPLLELAESEAPKLREHRQSSGVDCHACHATGCGYAGRYDSWGPHGMKQDTTRLPCAKFCGKCHEYEHQEYAALYVPSVAQGTRPKQCVGCHMPARYARLTEGHLLSLAHPKRAVHDHSFPVWTDRVLRGALEISEVEVARQGGKVEVSFTLTNRGAGHRIPSGKYGYRELKISAELRDAEGNVLATGRASLFGNRQNGLEPGKPTPLKLRAGVPAEANPTEVKVLVERVNEDRSFRQTLASLTRPVAVGNVGEPVPSSEPEGK